MCSRARERARFRESETISFPPRACVRTCVRVCVRLQYSLNEKRIFIWPWNTHVESAIKVIRARRKQDEIDTHQGVRRSCHVFSAPTPLKRKCDLIIKTTCRAIDQPLFSEIDHFHDFVSISTTFVGTEPVGKTRTRRHSASAFVLAYTHDRSSSLYLLFSLFFSFLRHSLSRRSAFTIPPTNYDIYNLRDGRGHRLTVSFNGLWRNWY